MGKGSSNTTSTSSTTSPWDGVTGYITGGNGAPGVLPSAASNYNSSAWTPGMTSNAINYLNNLSPTIDQGSIANRVGDSITNGSYNTSITPVSSIAGADKISAQQVSPTQAFSSLGEAAPTSALSNLLSGNVTNPYITNQANSIISDLTRNTNENVMPGINNDAVAAGQYGGSRQGIAQGLATSRLNQDTASALSNLYGNAYNSAQGLMSTTANNLANGALLNSTANANRSLSGDTTNAANQLSAQQYNAGLGLNNNEQAMQQAQNNLKNSTVGLQDYGIADNLNAGNYNNTQGALNAYNTYNNSNLNQYSNIINALTNSTRQTNTNTQQGGGSSLGGILGSMLGVATGGGSSLLGGLGDLLGITGDNPSNSSDPNAVTYYNYNTNGYIPLVGSYG